MVTLNNLWSIHLHEQKRLSKPTHLLLVIREVMLNPVLQLKGLYTRFQWEPPLSRRSSCSNSPQMSFPNSDSICATSFEASVRASVCTLASSPLVASHALWHSRTTVDSENCKIHWCWLHYRRKRQRQQSDAFCVVLSTGGLRRGKVIYVDKMWTDTYWFKVLWLLHNISVLSK